MLKTIIHSLTPGEDAISLLKTDHETVEALFKEFESAEDKRRKLSLAKTICMELALHDKLESKVFYPATKRMAKDAQHEINEGIVEHEAIRRLVKEIPQLKASDEFFDTRMDVLMEYVRHHVKEEEKAMFPKIVESEIDLKALGERMAKAKQKYQEEASGGTTAKRGVPTKRKSQPSSGEARA